MEYLMKDKMKAWLLEYLKTIQLSTRRKKIHIQQMEDFLMKEKIKDPIRYQEQNGYANLVQILNEFTIEGKNVLK